MLKRINFESKSTTMILLFILGINFVSGAAQPPPHSEQCLRESRKCENDTDCLHRLAVLQSACVTNTCQPQCREAALNLYQNRKGRELLRTDASCVPGRYELEKCGFLPNKSPKHCSFAKLICETDLQCNAKWEVFMSECDMEAKNGECSDKCRRHLNDTLETQSGAAFASCTCTNKEDNLCVQLREVSLRVCLETSATNRIPPRPPVHTDPNDINGNSILDNDPDTTKLHSHQNVPDSSTITAFSIFATIFSSFISLCFARICL